MFEIIEVTDFEVTIKDTDGNGNTSHVYLQGDGKWHCQRCNRLRCIHALFVKQSGVQLAPRKHAPDNDLDIDILTY